MDNVGSSQLRESTGAKSVDSHRVITESLSISSGYFNLSKAEQEDKVFSALVHLGEISLDDSRFGLALKLGVPQSKVDSLVFRFRMSNFSASKGLSELARHLKFVSVDSKKSQIVFSLEDKFFREYFIATLKQNSIFSDTSFNRELVAIHYTKLSPVVAVLFEMSSDEVSGQLESHMKFRKLSDLGSLVLKTAEVVGPMLFDIAQDIVNVKLSSGS